MQKSESGRIQQQDVTFYSDFHFFGRDFAIRNTFLFVTFGIEIIAPSHAKLKTKAGRNKI